MTRELAVGAVFAGHRIDGVAGRGGMGVVYRATQLALDRVVALKIVAPELVDDAHARDRFLRETRAAASIEHPHVIPVHYAGEEDGLAYLVMRYVSGDDLRSLVRREGPLEPDRAARIVGQVGEALDAAHAMGIVHRDVKPGNVLLADGDHAYLTDFGLVKDMRSASTTGSGRWVGTLDYVAPEQIRGERVDARTDAYGLGCVLYHALTGEVPFPRDSDEARLWAHLSDPAPTASDHGAPAAFDPVIARALAKRSDERYRSCGDLGRAAVAAATGGEVERRERSVARGAAAPAGERGASTTTARLPVAPRRRRARLAGALVAAGALAAVAAAALILPDGDEPTPRAPTAQPTVGASRDGTPRVTARIPIGPRPNTVALAGDRVWIGAFAATSVAAIDADTAAPLPDSPVAGPGTSGLDVARGVLWVVVSRQRMLMRLDAKTGEPVGEPIRFVETPVAVAAGKDDVWVGTSDPADVSIGSIRHVDPETGAVGPALRVPTGLLRFVSAHGSLWVLSATRPRLLRMDPDTGAIRDRITLPGRDGMWVTSGAGAIWVTMRQDDWLVRVDAKSLAQATVAVGERPAGVAVHDGTVWVANFGSSTLARIDARRLRPRGEPIDVPLNPYAVAAGDSGVWVTCVGRSVVARVEGV